MRKIALLPRLGLVCLVTLGGCSPPAEEQAAPPDLIFFNANVVTMDAADNVATALAISGDTITAIGSDAEVRALAGPATETIDLAGNTVTPGIIDIHTPVYTFSPASSASNRAVKLPASMAFSVQG